MDEVPGGDGQQPGSMYHGVMNFISELYGQGTASSEHDEHDFLIAVQGAVGRFDQRSKVSNKSK